MQRNTLTEDIAKLLLRLAAGGFMLTHGWSKAQQIIGGGPIQFADPIGLGPEISLYLAVFAEVICASLVLIGFKSRFAAIPMIITMGVAAFITHGADPFGRKEMALLYLIIYAVIALIGSGKYSIDGVISNKNRRY